MPNFSITLIARNEAQTLPKLFAGLEPFRARGGEIVLVDTGSSDETTRIAQAFGCRVYEMGDAFTTFLDAAQVQAITKQFSKNDEPLPIEPGQRLFHFANARNYASACAHNDFVFHPDAADELLAFDDAWLDAEIRDNQACRFEYWRIAAVANPQADAIQFRIANFFDRQLFHWEGHAHETVCVTDGADRNARRTIACAREKLLVRHIKDSTKARSYLAALALDLLAYPGNLRWMHYLGRELYYHGRFRSAIALLQEHAAREDGWKTEQSESLCLIARSYEFLGEPSNAEAAYVRAMKMDNTRREPFLGLALLKQKQGELEASVEYASTALEIPHASGYMESDANYTYLPHAILYWGLYWLGEKKQARQHWECCLAFQPNNARFKEHALLFELV